jgi:hypothetical protein
MGKYTINYTRDDNIILMRKLFLEVYLNKHLTENPDIKEKLEKDFQHLVKEEGI